MTCKKAILFYEVHSEKLPAQTMNQVILKLAQEGHETMVCLEEPVDESLEAIKETYQEQIAELRNLYIKDFNDPIIKNIINNQGIAFKGKKYHSHQEAEKKLSKQEKQGVIDSYNELAKSQLASTEASVNILNTIIKYPVLKYSGMDMTRISRIDLDESSSQAKDYDVRSIHMAHQLKEQCIKGSEYVVGLLGASHFDVAGYLRTAGLEVQDFYIVDTPVGLNSLDESDISDLCMRQDPSNKICTKYEPFQGTIYDIYANPDLNPFEDIISKILVADPNPVEL